MIAIAIQLAAEVHRHQKDKAGEAYILHPLAVMQMVRERYEHDSNRDTLMILAVLHDALEDFSGSEKDKLRFENMIESALGPQVLACLQRLSRKKEEPYEEYIERVAANWFTRIVKIADLTHNMDPRRIPASQIVDKDFLRWDKYRKALIRLERE